jgi:branched-subunit amino acid transport protein
MMGFDRRMLRDVGALAAAIVVIGVSFGAAAVAQGLPAWAPIAMSLLVYAGGAQFLAIGLLAVGNPVAAILGGLLINLRHLPIAATTLLFALVATAVFADAGQLAPGVARPVGVLVGGVLAWRRAPFVVVVVAAAATAAVLRLAGLP